MCLTLCDPMDCTIHEILQAKILEWVVFPFSGGSSQLRDGTQVSPALQANSLPAEPPYKGSGKGGVWELHGATVLRVETVETNCRVGHG